MTPTDARREAAHRVASVAENALAEGWPSEHYTEADHVTVSAAIVDLIAQLHRRAAAPVRPSAGGRRKAFNAEQLRTAQDMYDAGQTIDQIAERFEVCRSTTYRHLNTDHRLGRPVADGGVPRRSRCDAIPGLVDGYLAGATLKELGTEYGVSIDVVVRRLEQAGVPRRRRRGGNRGAATENPSEDHCGVPLT